MSTTMKWSQTGSLQTPPDPATQTLRIQRAGPAGADIAHVVITHDGKTMAVHMADGTTQQIEQPYSVGQGPGAYLVVLCAALLAANKRIDALEQQLSALPERR